MAVELVSRGAQDVYLTGNPEVSFFRQNYKRHTNFAQRSVKLDIMGNLAASSEVYVKIPNKGDLLGYIWLDLGSGTADSSGLDCTDEVNSAVIELWMGGQLIDRQDAFFMAQHWNKYLSDSSAKPSAASNNGDVTTSNWFPLHFSFCDSTPLPLVALQYHEVEVRVKFTSSSPSAVKFYANYIMLDTDERAAFVNVDHEILIEQVQKIGYSGNKYDLTLLNHPVKSLHFSNVSAAPITDAIQMYLNGTEIFNTPMPAKFFNQVQGYYHSEFGNSELSKQNSQLFMYSFALKANKHQPCGTCNFSRIDTAAFNISHTDGSAFNYMYAVNYNILRIKKGLAGLAFSN